ncbi:restriction endonuclease subunit S [Campylobacter concisus]|uniref:restriction endonuclease subunit S n=1 Tax=Campylobacter concisus TaxID=199 RepID=UPI00122CC055|nr:restriction endonuclease subunit S [Campylobacter concisus]
MSEFKNLPSGWSKYELGEICKISSSKFDPTKNSEVKKCIELEHLSQKTGQILGFISSSEQKSIKNEFKTGQILYGKLRPYLQKFCQAKFDGVCSSEIWVLQGKKVTNDFLFYLVQSDKFNQIANKTSGTKMPRADWEYMSEMPFFIPLEPEQKKIAEILSTWDEAINLTINLIESKKQFKKALMQNLLTAKINWHTTTLSNVGEIITVSTPSTTNEKFWNGEVAWITPTDIGDKKDIFIGERSITQDGLKAIRELPANSLLVTCIASIGKNAVLKVKGSCNQQINALIPNQNFNVDFLYYLLEFEKEKLKKLAGITATLIISKALFSKFKISFPDITEQQKIAEVLMACDDEINLLNLKLENLKKQKQGLMQKLLKGEMRTCYVKKAM